MNSPEATTSASKYDSQISQALEYGDWVAQQGEAARSSKEVQWMIGKQAFELASQLEPHARLRAKELLARTAVAVGGDHLNQVHSWIDDTYKDDSDVYVGQLHETLDIAHQLHSNEGLSVHTALASAPGVIAAKEAIKKAELQEDIPYNPDDESVDELRSDIADQIDSIAITRDPMARHMAIEGLAEIVEELEEELEEKQGVSTKDVVLVQAGAEVIAGFEDDVDTAEDLFKVVAKLKANLSQAEREEFERVEAIARQKHIDLLRAQEIIYAA